MFKYIKYKFNKAFEKNILYLFIFLFGISILGILLFAILLFLLQTVGLLSDENIFLQTLWYVFKLFYDQNAILSLNVEQNNLLDFISRFAVTIFGILVFSTIIGIITTFRSLFSCYVSKLQLMNLTAAYPVFSKCPLHVACHALRAIASTYCG